MCNGRVFGVLGLVFTLSLAAACDDEPGPGATPADAGADRPVDGSADLALEDTHPDVHGDGADASPADVGGVDLRSAAPDVPVSTVPTTNKLDLVFLVDNSSSMQEEQESLRAAFPALIKSLAARPGGLPDLRVGILSSNLGAGPTAVTANCPVGGDRGQFQVRPVCSSMLKSGTFIQVAADGANNLAAGAAGLADAFSCLAELGTTGCGYEHQLASLQFGLADQGPNNAGSFLRDDAVLGIVILSDEDDCSGSPSSADFYEDPVVGQAGSFRCSLRGHVCGGQPVPPMPFTAPLKDCVPYERNDATEEKSRLTNVGVFSNFIKNNVKKGRADRIFVATIMGWSDDPAATYRVVLNGLGVEIGVICSNPRTGSAAAGVRLHAFAKSFPNNAIYSICSPDLGVELGDIGKKLSALLPAAM